MASEQEEHIHNWSSRRTDLTHAYGVCRTCGVKGKRLLNQSEWEELPEDDGLTPMQRLQQQNAVLYRKNVELEQQLAQARKQLEIERDALVLMGSQLTEARALLKWWLFYASLPYTASAEVDEKLGLTRAFLAQHKEQSE